MDIKSLTGLRAIAACWVFIFHVGNVLMTGGAYPAERVLRVFGAAGYLGVDIFFVLSGFVLALNYGNAVTPSPRWYGSFLLKRFARLYPVHIAALILCCIYFMLCISLQLSTYSSLTRLTFDSLLRTLTLTHAWSIPVPKNWNPVSWSISAEWAAYLLFPLIAVMALRIRRVAHLTLLIVLLFVALASVIYFGFYNGTMAYGLPRIAVEFPAGVLVHRIWQLRGMERSVQFDRLGVLAIVGLIAVANLLDRHRGAVALPFMPIVACGVVYCFAAAQGGLLRFMSSSLMQAAGRMSYTFYMVNGVFLCMAHSVAFEYGLYTSLPAIVSLMLAATVLAVLCTIWIYHSIEEPARSAIIRLGQRRLVPGGGVLLKDSSPA